MTRIPQYLGKLVLFFLLLLSVCLLYFLRQPILHRISQYPIYRASLVPGELVVAISGGLPEIHFAIDLYHHGYAAKILFIGRFPVELALLSTEFFAIAERSWYENAKHIGIHAGVAEDDITNISSSSFIV